MYLVYTGLVILGILIMGMVVKFNPQLSDKKQYDLRMRDWVSYWILMVGAVFSFFGVLGFIIQPGLQADAKIPMYQAKIVKLKPQIKQVQVVMGVDKLQATRAKDTVSMKYYVQKTLDDKTHLKILQKRLAEYEDKVR